MGDKITSKLNTGLKIDRMLYEFHRAQNARKPGSLHATYLVTGIPKLEESQSNGHKLDGEDTLMQDDSFMSSSMPEQEEEREVVPVTSITLIREEDLDRNASIVAKARELADFPTDVKQLHASISSIHVYSLEPGPLQVNQIEIFGLTKLIYSEPSHYLRLQSQNRNRICQRRPPRVLEAVWHHT